MECGVDYVAQCAAVAVVLCVASGGVALCVCVDWCRLERPCAVSSLGVRALRGFGFAVGLIFVILKYT